MKRDICCTRIGVDCVANNRDAVHCGEPEYFGFDFDVQKEQTEEMKKFIVEALKSFEIPLIAIYNCEDMYLNKEMVWSKERIIKVISKNASSLKDEANSRIKY